MMNFASLSLDLDNKWAYLRSHGHADWQSLPSYFGYAVPRMLQWFETRGLTITFFVVGQDAVRDENRDPLQSIVAAGHEIANHSFHHEPWLHTYSRDQLRDELLNTEAALIRLTGQRPVGFRGPGYSYTDELLALLAELGYEYDASTFPTFLGPVARLAHAVRSRRNPPGNEHPRQEFSKLSDGLRPLRGFVWPQFEAPLVEIPVTTLPLLKTPIHLTYLVYLSTFSPWLAERYWQAALAACRATKVPPSILLHPLDFLGVDDEPELAFFPGMTITAQRKLAFLDRIFDRVQRDFECITMREHARRIRPLEVGHGFVAHPGEVPA